MVLTLFLLSKFVKNAFIFIFLKIKALQHKEANAFIENYGK
jgi:hypothetical protein